jgi:hypothetical protein
VKNQNYGTNSVSSAGNSKNSFVRTAVRRALAKKKGGRVHVEKIADRRVRAGGTRNANVSETETAQLRVEKIAETGPGLRQGTEIAREIGRLHVIVTGTGLAGMIVTGETSHVTGKTGRVIEGTVLVREKGKEERTGMMLMTETGGKRRLRKRGAAVAAAAAPARTAETTNAQSKSAVKKRGIPSSFSGNFLTILTLSASSIYCKIVLEQLHAIPWLHASRRYLSKFLKFSAMCAAVAVAVVQAAAAAAAGRAIETMARTRRTEPRPKRGIVPRSLSGRRSRRRFRLREPSRKTKIHSVRTFEPMHDILPKMVCILHTTCG